MFTFLSVFCILVVLFLPFPFPFYFLFCIYFVVYFYFLHNLFFHVHVWFYLVYLGCEIFPFSLINSSMNNWHINTSVKFCFFFNRVGLGPSWRKIWMHRRCKIKIRHRLKNCLVEKKSTEEGLHILCLTKCQIWEICERK